MLYKGESLLPPIVKGRAAEGTPSRASGKPAEVEKMPLQANLNHFVPAVIGGVGASRWSRAVAELTRRLSPLQGNRPLAEFEVFLASVRAAVGLTSPSAT